MRGGMMGFKINEDDAKDKFAMINMRERCTSSNDKMKPLMVVNNFKQSSYSWVFPVSFDKRNQPKRTVIVSRTQGVKID
jgi:hypothetical protein